MNEEWRQIPDFPEYAVSNHGRVARNGGDVLSSAPNAKGYHVVSLRREGSTVSQYVHNLVARVFLGLRDGMTVNHKDRNRANNHISNLEELASEDNSGHGRVSPKTIQAIMLMRRRGDHPERIAALLKIRLGVVLAVIREKERR